MSGPNQARRVTAQIFFQGADITGSMRPYFLSATYTDKEADGTDDLQLKLQDRDDIWLKKWLADAIDAAASAGSLSASSKAKTDGAAKSYKVTAKSGLNVRSGPSTSYGKYGALVCGAELQVEGIENGWAKVSYNGKTAYVSASYIKESGGGGGDASAAAPASASGAGFKISAVFVRENWTGGGRDKVLDCGQFELDSVDASGPPNTITIKATALPYSAQIRQTEKSKAWEAYTLSGIANEMAAANGMTCMFLANSDPSYGRVEQYKQSDIAFLSKLCHEAGISLKATNNLIVLFDQEDYEKKSPVLTIVRGSGSYTKHKLNAGTAGTQYASCRVSYTDPGTGKCIEATVKVEDYNDKAKNNQQLEITAKVASVAEAKTKAEKYLRLHNKYAKTATLRCPAIRISWQASQPSSPAGVRGTGNTLWSRLRTRSARPAIPRRSSCARHWRDIDGRRKSVKAARSRRNCDGHRQCQAKSASEVSGLQYDVRMALCAGHAPAHSSL